LVRGGGISREDDNLRVIEGGAPRLQNPRTVFTISGAKNEQLQRKIMTGKPTQAFTMSDLNRWEAIGIAEQPDMPSHASCITAPSISSFNSKGLNTGLVANLKLDNGETLMVHINPVVALQLLNNIIDCGKRGGWMDSNARITFPIVSDTR
jgi:hypothetical protein